MSGSNQTNEQGKQVALLWCDLHARLRQDAGTRTQGLQLIVLGRLMSQEIHVEPVIHDRVLAHALSGLVLQTDVV